MLRSHLSKETTKENVVVSQKIGQKFVTNDTLTAGRGLPPISQVISSHIFNLVHIFILRRASESCRKFEIVKIARKECL